MDDEGKMQMSDVASKALEYLQDPKFSEEVETFVNLHIDDFAVATVDGSCPISWTMLHRKYKKLYEDQLQRALDECGADVTEFMDYMSACGEHYGDDPNFKALLAALTASQEFEAFQQVMFAAVRDNWAPDEGAAPPPPDAQNHAVDVTVPEGYGPGTTMAVAYLGLTHQVVVPEDVTPGMAMRAELVVPIAPTGGYA
eukprot:TRINITY_DN95633_c0_g1_i1.p1 TRINITY_DN95633_c0_g1~~TRINITY_DN95633_c0_g1_i1.p1  ORF type:complete len:198 (+),score=41.47 TRINITY_DN95633_c0_g1_i1:29-622(+)